MLYTTVKGREIERENTGERKREIGRGKGEERREEREAT